jgi:gas vesicle protein
MKVKSLLIGFLTGSIIAGATTLLTAPASGKETRNRIRQNKDEITGLLLEIKDRIVEIKNESVNVSKVGKESLQTFIADVKVLLDEWKTDIEPNKNALNNRIQEIESAVNELETVAADSPVVNKTTIQ